MKYKDLTHITNFIKEQTARIEVISVNKYFNSIFAGKKCKVQAVNNVSFQINRGDKFGIIGTSGCGKTTLARIVLGLIKPDSGTVNKYGKIGFVAQDPYASLSPNMTVREIVREPLRFLSKINKSKEIELVDNALNAVHLNPLKYADRLPSKLSGGKRQRVSIARAIVIRPDFLVMDEPTSMLDEAVKKESLDVIRVIVEKEQCSLLMITHDIAMSANMCDKLLVMENGCIVEVGDKEQVFNNPQHPFTKKLILAATDIEGYWEKIGITKAETKE